MKEIKAREGYYLTQLQEVQDRIYVTIIKGQNVYEDDWREATREEKEEYEKMMEENISSEILETLT